MQLIYGCMKNHVHFDGCFPGEPFQYQLRDWLEKKHLQMTYSVSSGTLNVNSINKILGEQEAAGSCSVCFLWLLWRRKVAQIITDETIRDGMNFLSLKPLWQTAEESSKQLCQPVT